MGNKETSPVYVEGQEIQLNFGSSISPEWVNGKVVDIDPKTKSLLLRGFEKFLGIEPIILKVDENSPTLAGSKVTAYKNGSKVKPKSVR